MLDCPFNFSDNFTLKAELYNCFASYCITLDVFPWEKMYSQRQNCQCRHARASEQFHWKVKKNKTTGNAGTLVSSLGAGFSQWKERLHNEQSEHSLFSLTAESTQSLYQFHNCHSCPFCRVLYILGIMALRAALLFNALLYQGLGSRGW